jgi:hypothetical protein|tara:strand:- start:740 stop:943 length:204 start_codon:yes stop_codon:yes gene_type:complete
MRRLQKEDEKQKKGVAAGMETEHGNDEDISLTSGSGQSERLREIGGPKGPEPTRFGDWERAGRCIDF